MPGLYLARIAAVRGDFDLARQLLDGALDQNDPFSKRNEAEEFRGILKKSESGSEADDPEAAVSGPSEAVPTK